MTRQCVRLVICLLPIISGCATSVPREDVPGSYVASYPFGSDELVLNADGTFIQKVSITGEQPMTTRGSWRFDAGDSELSLFGSFVVDDGFGKLRPDWRHITRDAVELLPVERIWFKVNVGSGGEFPYVKRK